MLQGLQHLHNTCCSSQIHSTYRSAKGMHPGAFEAQSMFLLCTARVCMRTFSISMPNCIAAQESATAFVSP